MIVVVIFIEAMESVVMIVAETDIYILKIGSMREINILHLIIFSTTESSQIHINVFDFFNSIKFDFYKKRIVEAKVFYRICYCLPQPHVLRHVANSLLQILRLLLLSSLFGVRPLRLTTSSSTSLNVSFTVAVEANA